MNGFLALTIPFTTLRKLSSLAEEELMSLLSKSDPHAFTQIYVDHQATVLAYAQRITGHRPAAEDIAQDVFVKIWEQRKVADKIRHLKRYLLTMCKHRAFDWLAKKERDQKLREEMRRCAEEFRCDAENALQCHEYHDLLHNAIKKLPPKRKLIFTLCKLDGISYDEVAEQMEVSPGTINDHIVKGTRFVKEYLKLYGISRSW